MNLYKIIQLRAGEPNETAGSNIVLEVSYELNQTKEVKTVKILPSNKIERVAEMNFQEFSAFIKQLQEIQDQMSPRVTEEQLRELNKAVINKMRFGGRPSWI